MTRPLLSVRDLEIGVGGGRLPSGPTLVEGVGFDVGRGEALALVGESGSGKTLTARALLGLLPRGTELRGGSIRLEGQELAGRPAEELRPLLGRRLGMVFQDPATALDPLFPIGRQMIETLRATSSRDGSTERERALELFDRVGLDDPALRFRQVPHQLSGGQRQRVLIALALAGRPDLLIADEPTTALDPILRRQLVELWVELRGELGFALLLLTHDLPLARALCDRALVLHRGHLVEETTLEDLLSRPRHPATRALVASLTLPSGASP